MIPGLSSSPGIAMAVRTASKARATMDTMSLQIATGQRVASVKDDGAGWSRANAMRTDATASRALAASIDMIATGVTVARDSSESLTRVLSDARNVALAADHSGLSVATRQALQAEQSAHQASYAFLMNLAQSVVPMTNLYGAPWEPFATQDEADTLGWTSRIDGGQSVSYFGHMNLSLDFADVSSKPAATASVAAARQLETAFTNRTVQLNGLVNWLAADTRRLDSQADRLDSAAAHLTEANLGKASTARSQAETRQQLALATVRQAISTYGSFASGLMGNVLSTQRAIA
jgi:flagellin